MQSRREWDHPRICGEKSDYLDLWMQQSGITPAYAGKSIPG